MTREKLIEKVSEELKKDLINKDYILSIIASYENQKAKEAYNEVREVKKMKAVEKVCQMFEITEEDLISKSREGNIPLARFLLFKNYRNVKMPFDKIGRLFGGFDHTTVIHGIKRLDMLHEVKDTVLMHHAKKDLKFFNDIMNGQHFE